MRKLFAVLFLLLIAPSVAGILPLMGVGKGTNSGGDPFFSSVVLLLPFEGTNGATTGPGFSDLSGKGHDIGPIAGSSISTTQAEFSTSSYLCVATGCGLTADSTDWLLSSANSDQFTVEASVYYISVAANNIIISQYAADGTFSWGFQLNGSNQIQFGFSPNGTFASGTYVSGGTALTTGQWYQIAADKDATGKIRVYRNGVMVASNTPANSAFFNSSARLGVGTTDAGGGILNGYLDNIRITKGAARYASDGGYTLPTAPFPTN